MSTSEQANTTPAWAENVEYAGFFIRFMASLIDTVVLILPLSLALGVVFIATMGEATAPDIMSTGGASLTGAQVLAIILEHFSDPAVMVRWLTENVISTVLMAGITIAFWYYFSATPGKIWLGIKIVDAETGEPTTVKQDCLRYAGYFLSIIPAMLGFAWVLFDKRSQGWHDKLAGTVVVRKKTLPPELQDSTRQKQDAATPDVA